MKKITLSVLVVIMSLLICYYGGMDFDKKGPLQAYLLVVSLFLGAMVYSFLRMEEQS